jgi:hypothetical protein
MLVSDESSYVSGATIASPAESPSSDVIAPDDSPLATKRQSRG